MPPENFKSDIFADIIEQYRSEIERGWHILMRGIIIEVVAALGISIISGLEIADLTEKAALAIEQSKKFDLSRVELEAELEQSRSNNLQLKIELAAAFASADAAKQFAGDAKMASQNAQETAAKLPKSRYLTVGGATRLAVFLQPVKPMAFDLEIESGEDEPKMVGGQIASVFSKSGFEMKGNTVNFSGRNDFGVKIKLKEVPSDDFAFTLKQLFKLLGQPTDVSLETNLNVGMKIEVYPRPIQ